MTGWKRNHCLRPHERSDCFHGRPPPRPYKVDRKHLSSFGTFRALLVTGTIDPLPPLQLWHDLAGANGENPSTQTSGRTDPRDIT
jgi:hypothetical protein